MSDKGKGKATQVAGSASPSSAKANSPAPATSSTAASGAASTSTATAAATSGPPMHTKGDWTAVWNADVGKYYYWNRKTNTTTWTNPFQAGDAPLPPAASSTDGTASPAATAAAEASSSSSKDANATKAQSPQPGASTEKQVEGQTNGERAGSSGPPAADYGGIDPDLAYLDPSLASRARGAGGAGAYVARFNARTGKFEADPTKTPDRVSDVQRAKRQNQFYFDYDGWQATLAQQQEQNALKRGPEGGSGDEDGNKKHRPSKKEMEAIRARNKEKKDKKQKGWLMN